MPVVTLPDGSQKTFERPVSVADIALLIQHFSATICEKLSRPIPRYSAEATEATEAAEATETGHATAAATATAAR